MLSGIYNITCEQGATFIRLIQIEYPDAVDPSIFLPFDLSGYTARMQIRRTIDSSNVIISLDSEDNGIEMQYAGVENALRIHIEDEQTALISSDGVYDLEIESADGVVSRVIRGSFTLIPEVTR
jgi:hypothetical protein